MFQLIFITPRACARGKVIGRVVVVVVVSKRLVSILNESIEFGEKLASMSVKSMDTVHGCHKINSAFLLTNIATPIDSAYSRLNAYGMPVVSHHFILLAFAKVFGGLDLWRLFHWGVCGGGRTLSQRAGRTSLIDGVPPDVYFTSPGCDSTGDAIWHDTVVPYISVAQCITVYVGLAQARPNYDW